jgi:hypothetical protein
MNEESGLKTLEDELTEFDPPYESREEAVIGRLLDNYGIPFFYKQATIIYSQGRNEIWNPTFTLPQYGCSLVDYLQDEAAIPERINIYRYNQIPATVLSPKDLDKPNFQQELCEKLQRQIGRLQNLSFYKAP